MRPLVAILALALLVPAAMAYPSPRSAPRYWESPCAPDKHFVFDFTGMVDDAHGAAWEAQHCAFYQQTGVHFAIVLTTGTDGEALGPYAAGLVDYWGIGSADKGDGAML